MPARSTPTRQPVAVPTADVTAVLVAHDGATWLPEVLAALDALTVRPRLLVAVDTGSTDGSADLLRAALGPDAVHVLPRRTGYGAAVAAGLELADAAAGPSSWLWLLHDDAAPAPDCLAALLGHAEATPSAALLGPKVLDWADPRVLVEVGITTDRAGHRETGLERREPDQGQHDAPRDVLAVGTAGALVERSLWDALGGLDPVLPLFRDELDLGWRVNAAGARVVVVPQAEIRHARAATTGRRSRGAVRGRAAAVDRRHALLVLLAHASRRRLLVTLPALFVGQLLRALGHVLTRQVVPARDEIAALAAVLARPDRLLAARRARRATRTVPPAAVRPLLASRTGRLRTRLQWVGEWLAGGAPAGADRPLDDVGPDATDEAMLRTGSAGVLRAVLSRPPVLLVLGVALVALVAERALTPFSGGLLSGGRLLPAPGGAGELWAAYAASWSSVGVGTPAPPAPATAVLAALSTVLLGKAWLAVDLLLLASVPLAAATAYASARRVVASPVLRAWAAATWALLPVATGAVAAGRLDAAAVQVALPLLAVGTASVLAGDPRGSWHRVWGLALGFTVVASLAPTLWLVAAPVLLAAGGFAVATAPRAQLSGARRRAAAAGLVAVLPAVLVLPWSLAVWHEPGLLLHGPGRLVTDAALVEAALPAWHLPLLAPGGAGLPPAWLTAGLLLAALAGLLPATRRSTAVRAWFTASAGLLVALVLARTSAQVPASGVESPVWPGIPLQVAAAGLLVAALVGADGARKRLARSDFGWRQLAAGGVAVAAGLLPLVAAGAWVTRGADGPVQRDTARVVPAFVQAELAAEPGVRVLVLGPDDDGAVGYDLRTGDGVRLGSAGLPLPDSQLTRLDDVVADLLSVRGSDAAGALATRGVRYVAMPPGPGAAQAAAALDTQAGLTRRSDDPVLLWEVLAPAARLTLVPPELVPAATSGERAPDVAAVGGAPPVPLLAGQDEVADVPPGPPGRLLVLAEAVDPGWRAELDGEPLEPTAAWGWAQAFTVPAAGGELVVSRDDDRGDVLAVQAVAVLLVAVLAVPARRRPFGLEPDDEGDVDDVRAAGVRPDVSRRAAGGRRRRAARRRLRSRT